MYNMLRHIFQRISDCSQRLTNILQLLYQAPSGMYAWLLLLIILLHGIANYGQQSSNMPHTPGRIKSSDVCVTESTVCCFCGCFSMNNSQQLGFPVTPGTQIA